MAADLLQQVFWPILGVGDQAVAAHTNQLHPIAKVMLQSGEFRLHMLHERAVGAEHHQQHGALVERTAVQPAARDLGKIKAGQRRVERQHRGWCQGHDVRADGANLLQDGRLWW